MLEQDACGYLTPLLWDTKTFIDQSPTVQVYNSGSVLTDFNITERQSLKDDSLSMSQVLQPVTSETPQMTEDRYFQWSSVPLHICLYLGRVSDKEKIKVTLNLRIFLNFTLP